MSDWMDSMNDAAREAIRAKEDRQIAERTYGTYSPQAKTTAQKEWDVNWENHGDCHTERPK